MIAHVCVVLLSLLFCGCNAQFKNCTSWGCSDYTEVGQCDGPSGICRCAFAQSNATSAPTIPCFSYNETDNFCQLLTCTSFDTDSLQCRNGTKSRLTALILGIFLVNLGAANFYIARYEFAIPQLILGLLLCILQIGTCVAECSRDSDPTISCVSCCFLNSVVSLTFLAWWIADIVQFATNARQDGNGCPLFT